MPKALLKDPADLARATAALERAWAEVQGSVDPGRADTELERLAFIVSSFAIVALDEDDLTERAIIRFRRCG